jgi:hypothetical protein
VGSLNDMSLIANASHLFDFPTVAFALSANTRYWIGISTVNNSNAAWEIEFVSGAVPPGDVGVTGEFIDDTNTISPVDFTAGSTKFREAFQMQVTLSPTAGSVPEPSAFLFGAAGLASISLLAWRRRRRVGRHAFTAG